MSNWEELTEIDKLQDLENDRHQKILEQIEYLRARASKRCPKTSKKFHPDPGGNNDSEYECNDCGVFFRHNHP